MKKLFRQWMQGRCGPDYLGNTMAISAAALMLLALFFRLFRLAAVMTLPLFAAGFRFFSRDIYARRKENDRFVCLVWPIKTKISRVLRKIFKKKKKSGK